MLFPLKCKRGIAMSLQSDRWIRKKAQEEGMIKPFSDHLVRETRWEENCQLWPFELWV